MSLNAKSKNILITSARSFIALDLARKFHSAGHRVFTADTMSMHVSRFSRAVTKNFTIPSPRLKPKEFIAEMVKISEQNKIDIIVPIYEEILYLAEQRDQFPKTTEIFGPPFPLLNELHSKWLFTLKQRELGIETPKTYLIEKVKDLDKIDRSVPYAVKASYSRASLEILKLSPGQPVPQLVIEPHNPWVAQEWLNGEKFCSYSICRDGVVRAHSLYPVGHTANGQGCIVFTSIDHPNIRKWIETFVKHIKFTGQIAFDFIETPDKKVYAIECNPRATSGAHLFENIDHIDQAFLKEPCPTIYPLGRPPKQLGIAMMMYGWRENSMPENSFKKFANVLFNAKDVVFNYQDPMPFLSEPLVLTSIWYNSVKYGLTFPEFFMYDYEWNGITK